MIRAVGGSAPVAVLPRSAQFPLSDKGTGLKYRYNSTIESIVHPGLGGSRVFSLALVTLSIMTACK